MQDSDLKAIVVSPNAGLTAHIEEINSSMGSPLVFAKAIPGYPSALELSRAMRAYGPVIIFLDFEHSEKAHSVLKNLRAEFQHVQVIAIHRVCDAPILRETMRAGIRELLAEPIDREMFAESICAVKELLAEKKPVFEVTQHLFSFLPSKAGVGATTLALNVSAALARQADTRVVLSDFDLNSGMIRFLLKLNNQYSVLDALEQGAGMDEHLWEPLITRHQGLDVLHSGGINPSVRIEPEQIQNLVQFMRRNYDVLCFDLSGNLERYSVEIMQESRRILLVCTPEIASLHMAREKLAFLRTKDLISRVSIILNRVHRHAAIPTDKVEEILGLKVTCSLANDYAGVNEATRTAQVLDPNSTLGRQISEFAHALMGRVPPETRGEGKRKFLELFSVPGILAPHAEK